MPTVMLVFLISILGNAMTLTLGYPSLDACERDMTRVTNAVKSDETVHGYFAVCGTTIPAKDDV